MEKRRQSRIWYAGEAKHHFATVIENSIFEGPQVVRLYGKMQVVVRPGMDRILTRRSWESRLALRRLLRQPNRLRGQPI